MANLPGVSFANLSGWDYLNSNTSYLDHQLPLQDGIRTMIIVTISLMIISSNVLNIAILRRTKAIPHISKICLTSLSVADLSVGVFTSLPSTVPSVLGYWPFGDVWCQFSGVLYGTSVTVSIWSLAIVSIDRYVALSKPLHYPSVVTTRRCYVVLTTSWITASLIFMSILPFEPNFIYYQFNFNECQCGLYWKYRVFCIVTGIAIPCTSGCIICITTMQIFKRLRLNKAPRRFSQHQVQHRNSRDTKAFKILTTTVLLYFFLWGPYVASVVTSAINPNIITPKPLQFVFTWMANSNSFVNVLIYSSVYNNFRREVKIIFKSIFWVCWKKSAFVTYRMNTYSNSDCTLRVAEELYCL